MNKYINNILRNVKYLIDNSLENKEKEIIWETIKRVEEVYEYNIKKEASKIIILNENDTLDLLIKSPKSFCRFGDGEINLIEGKSIPFQQYDKNLADKMLKILKNDIPNLYVGLGYKYYHFDLSSIENEFINRFLVIEGYHFRKFMNEVCCTTRVYIDTGFNQRYINSPNENLDRWFDKIKMLFQGKKLVVFIGEGIISNVQYDVFERAIDVKYILGPSQNAYSQYDNLYNTALRYDKSYILCFVLGPVSKILVNDLTEIGYLAWDLGHLVKDYDYYKRNIKQSNVNIISYYRPDIKE